MSIFNTPNVWVLISMILESEKDTHSEAERNDPLRRMAMWCMFKDKADKLESIEKRDATLEDLARIYKGGEFGYMDTETVPYWIELHQKMHPILEEINK